LATARHVRAVVQGRSREPITTSTVRRASLPNDPALGRLAGRDNPTRRPHVTCRWNSVYRAEFDLQNGGGGR
jgi:hypothetical protein